MIFCTIICNTIPQLADDIVYESPEVSDDMDHM